MHKIFSNASTGYLIPSLPVRFIPVREKVRTVLRTETHLIQHLRNLEHQEGWNPGVRDIESMIESGQVEVLALTDEYQSFGYISKFQSDYFSFLGSFIVPKSLRGNGYGERLWQSALNGMSGTTGLYANPIMANYYAKSGFETLSVIRRLTVKPLPCKDHKRQSPKLPSDGQSNALDISSYDRKITGLDRAPLLHRFLSSSLCVTTCRSTPHSPIHGYGIIRELMDGLRVTMYAPSVDEATQMLQILMAKALLLRPELNHTSEFNCVIDIPAERLELTKQVLDQCQLEYREVPYHDFHLPFMIRSFQSNALLNTPLGSQTFGLLSLEAG
jgi:hypothetical protein